MKDFLVKASSGSQRRTDLIRSQNATRDQKVLHQPAHAASEIRDRDSKQQLTLPKRCYTKAAYALAVIHVSVYPTNPRKFLPRSSDDPSARAQI